MLSSPKEGEAMPRDRRKAPTREGPRIAVGYVRVSTNEQKASGAGLQAQRAAIRAECDRRGWTLAHTHQDRNGISGSSLRRPALKEALKALSAGSAQILVTSKLDRLSRSVLDFATLMQQAEREGWAIVVLDVNVDTLSPSGEMMANVVASFAQYERRLISERTTRALAVKRAEGVQLGRPRSVPPKVRKRIAALRSNGMSYQAIADVLNEGGVERGQKGSRWHASTVHYLVNNE
jgi:DNA invertase Pin-like site-specific DNA recombinase